MKIATALLVTLLTGIAIAQPIPGGFIPTPANDDLANFGQANTLGYKVKATWPKAENYVCDVVLHDLDGDKKDEILTRYS